jgi:hypothetical protein
MPSVSFTCFITFEVISWKGIMYRQLLAAEK